MFTRACIGIVFAGGTAAATATFADSKPGLVSPFDSSTELVTVIEKVRPNNIVLGDPDAHAALLPEPAHEEPSLRDAWQKARDMMLRVSHAVHEDGQAAPAFAATPCADWSDVDTNPAHAPESSGKRCRR